MEDWEDCEGLRPRPKEKWIVVDKKSEDTKHRTEWCAEANGSRCMRCGRGTKYMKIPGTCTGPKVLFVQNLSKMEESDAWEVTSW